jgi:thioredoxin reductase (NADPH)
MYDMIIIGGGPAGLSAAVYGMRAGLKLLVLEQNPMSGGQVLNTYEVDNYLGLPGINGFDLGMKFREHVKDLGAELKQAKVTAVTVDGEAKKVTTADGNEYEARTLLLAMGAEHAKLGVPGEVEFTGRGVSYCATCDGAFFKGSEVAVVGGGDVAVEDAIYLSRLCRKVHLIHRRDSLRAAKSLQDKLFACKNVEIHWNETVSEILGGEAVESVRLRSAADENVSELEVAGVFVAIGMHPDTGMLGDVIKKDASGYVIASEDCTTNVPGIFAAGDIRTKSVRQIVTAVSDGACAVAAAEHYLRA